MNLLALPVLIPLLSGSLLLLVGRRRARTALATVASVATLIASLVIAAQALGGRVLVLQMADWAAPFGISLVADGLAAVLLVASSLLALLTVVFAGAGLRLGPSRGVGPELNRAREAFGTQALFQFLFMGVHMSFLTGDLFNLFVAFEVMLIASYGLMLIGGELPQLREGFKYVVINLVASAIFVVSAGLTYGLVGSLNMADIGRRVVEHGPDLRVTLVAGMLALVFATKSAVFPLGFWLPNSYPTPPAATSAYFGAVLTKVGAYALIRAFTLMFPGQQTLGTVLLILATLTIVAGTLGMIARPRWRHAMAFANVASVGYLLVGVFIGTGLGMAAAVYYLMNSIAVIFALFLVAAMAERIGGQNFRTSGHLGSYPWLGIGFFVAGLALAGIPPTSGFIGKFALVQALLAAGGGLRIAVTVTALACGLLLLYAVVRIWQGFFWGDSDAVHNVEQPVVLRAATAMSVAVMLALAVFAGPLFDVSSRIAAQLDGNDAYLESVLIPDAPPRGDQP